MRFFIGLSIILAITACETNPVNQANSRGCYSETAHSWCKGAK